MAAAFSSEEVLDYPCSPCQRQNKGVEAHVGCQTCQQYFCRTCRAYHDSLHPDHKVKTNFRQLSFVQLTERCPRHVEEVIKMYCPTHDEVTCSICITLNHRSCATARYIPTDIKQLLTQSDLLEINKTLGGQEESLRISRGVLQQHLQKLELDQVRATTSIQDTHRKLVTTLEGLMNNTVKEVEAKSREISLEINIQLRKTDRILGELQRTIQQMKSTDLSKAQIFVTMKQYKPKIAEAEKLNDTILNSSGQHGLIFSIDSRLEKCLAEMKALANVNRKHLHLYRKAKTFSKPIVVEGDKNCSITSCCVIGDGSVVLADNSNKKLKHLQSANMSVQSSHVLEEGPRSVCSTIHNEVVVCSDKRSVHIFEVANGFVPKGAINLNHDCRSIAYSNGELYISDGGKHVQVYNNNAAFVRSLGSTSSETRLNKADQIMFNADGTKLLIVDSFVGNTLICVDWLGKYLYRDYLDYKSEKQKAAAICSDGGQGFFVKDTKSANILQLGAKGEKMGKVLKESDNGTTPQAICFNPTTRHLIVASASNTIQVYQLV